MYRFKAAKMYSSGDKEYFLLPPSISCVSKTRYFKKTKYDVNLTEWLFKNICSQTKTQFIYQNKVSNYDLR